MSTTGFFSSFFIATVFVFLNLFVAVLLENFEMNFESETLDVNIDHIEHFKELWILKTKGPKHDVLAVADIEKFVGALVESGNPLGRVAQDEFYKNRLLFELDDRAAPRAVNFELAAVKALAASQNFWRQHQNASDCGRFAG